ncbi:MAG: hypothetical protein HOQ45_11920 [Nocardioidaceae bacterium]|nr:hypothetical protein [Nocardioidaceae bacterium]
MWRRKQHRVRLEESKAAIETQDRLAAAIHQQREEALRVSAWARTTLERNGLAHLLFTPKGGASGATRH